MQYPLRQARMGSAVHLNAKEHLLRLQISL